MEGGREGREARREAMEAGGREGRWRISSQLKKVYKIGF